MHVEVTATPVITDPVYFICSTCKVGDFLQRSVEFAPFFFSGALNGRAVYFSEYVYTVWSLVTIVFREYIVISINVSCVVSNTLVVAAVMDMRVDI